VKLLHSLNVSGAQTSPVPITSAQAVDTLGERGKLEIEELLRKHIRSISFDSISLFDGSSCQKAGITDPSLSLLKRVDKHAHVKHNPETLYARAAI